MPKARQTCTRCSMRRQKCDKKEPCGRCVQAGEADSCSRIWIGGYDARIHRTYPKGGSSHHRRPSAQYLSTPSRRGSEGSSLQHSSSEVDSDDCTSSIPSRRRSRVATGLEDIAVETRPNLASEALHPNYATGYHHPFPEIDVRERSSQARFRKEELHSLASCLPNGYQILQMIDYHEDSLKWIHGCIHGPTFRKEVVRALQCGNGRILLNQMDMRWCAVLFAVLTATLTCAPASQRAKWHYDRAQKVARVKKWHEATIECLVLGEFNSKAHPYSVQAIQMLALSSHTLGLSHRQFTMSGAALRTAQALGLQRLSYDHEKSRIQFSEEIALSTEANRRLWWNLAMSDWFSVSTTDMHCINPQEFTTCRPRPYVSASCPGKETDEHPEAEVDYANHFIDMATILLESHTSTAACIDPALSYEQILKYDARLRELGAKGFNTRDTSQTWIPWAKSIERCAVGHKLIILHRSFLIRSFRDPSFSYARWASIEGSKTIIKGCKEAFTDPNRPTIFVEQAWIISAGITLCLDIMHRHEGETEYPEHFRLVEQAIACLDQCEDSVLASRGRRLLLGMLKERLTSSGFNNSGEWITQPSETPNLLAGFDPILLEMGQARGGPSWSGEAASCGIHDSGLESIVQLPTPETNSSLNPSMFEESLTEETILDPLHEDMSKQAPPAQTCFDDLFADPSWTDMLSDFVPDLSADARCANLVTNGQVPLYHNGESVEP